VKSYSSRGEQLYCKKKELHCKREKLLQERGATALGRSYRSRGTIAGGRNYCRRGASEYVITAGRVLGDTVWEEVPPVGETCSGSI
jgi:hypothetical protein